MRLFNPVAAKQGWESPHTVLQIVNDDMPFLVDSVSMALAEMGKIEAEIGQRWPGSVVAIVHRTGTVAIGEPSVVISVGAAHRVEAYEASRYAIEELKARVPVWKRETYADGTAWIANRS